MGIQFHALGISVEGRLRDAQGLADGRDALSRIVAQRLSHAPFLLAQCHGAAALPSTGSGGFEAGLRALAN